MSDVNNDELGMQEEATLYFDAEEGVFRDEEGAEVGLGEEEEGGEGDGVAGGVTGEEGDTTPRVQPTFTRRFYDSISLGWVFVGAGWVDGLGRLLVHWVSSVPFFVC